MNLLLIVKMVHLNSTEFRRVVFRLITPPPPMYPVYEDGDCNEIFDAWFRNLLESQGTIDNGSASIDDVRMVQMLQDQDAMYHLRPYSLHYPIR